MSESVQSNSVVAGSSLASREGATIKVEVIELTQAGVDMLTSTVVGGLTASPSPAPRDSEMGELEAA